MKMPRYQQIVLNEPIPVADTSDHRIWRYLILKSGVYQVVRVPDKSGMEGIAVDWYVLVDQPHIGAAIPVWEGTMNG